jgi:hypothetical protein
VPLLLRIDTCDESIKSIGLDHLTCANASYAEFLNAPVAVQSALFASLAGSNPQNEAPQNLMQLSQKYPNVLAFNSGTRRH